MLNALKFERRERMLVFSEMIEMCLLSGILATAWDEREDVFCPYAYGRRYPGWGVGACTILVIGVSLWVWSLGTASEFVSFVLISIGRREAGRRL